jgi:O-antigen/teichoic acid export membrane protein
LYERLRAFLGTRLFREVAITYTGQLLGSGIGFLLQILLQGQLGPEDYGVLGLAGSVGQLTGVLTDIGLSHAMIRFGSPHVSEGRPEQAMTRFAGTLLVRFLLACVVAGVGFASASAIAVGVFAKPALIEPLTWIYVGIFGSTLYSFWMFYIQTWQKFGVRSVVQVVVAVVRAVAFTSLWSMSMLTPTTMIMIDGLVPLGGFALGMAVSPGEWRKVDWREASKVARTELLPYCRFTGIMVVGDHVFNELDTFMLGIYEDTHTVGVFRCAWIYSQVLGFLNLSVSNVLFPKVTSVRDAAELRVQMRRILKFTAVLGVATLPVLPFISWWIPYYQPQYAAAVPVFSVMYVGVVFELVVGPLGYVLYSLDRPGVLAGNAIFKIALNFAGNLVMIPWLGALGAAIATVFTRIVGGIVALWLIERGLRVRERENAEG